MTYDAGTFPSPMSYTGPDAPRWTASRKAALVERVLDGEIRLEDALRIHGFSAAEFSALVAKFEAGGYAALRQTKRRSTPRLKSRRGYGVARAVRVLRSVGAA
jgi:Protein of unknown function (DUF1153)